MNRKEIEEKIGSLLERHDYSPTQKGFMAYAKKSPMYRLVLDVLSNQIEPKIPEDEMVVFAVFFTNSALFWQSSNKGYYLDGPRWYNPTKDFLEKAIGYQIAGLRLDTFKRYEMIINEIDEVLNEN